MQDYIVVVGGVNVDITGTTDASMLQGDSNPGRVTVTPGGVGRNIAENISRMGVHTILITVLGDDDHAELIRRSCEDAGMDLRYAVTLPKHRTSTYVCLNDVDGDVYAAVSDMSIYDSMTCEMLEERRAVLDGAALVVVDANMPEHIIDWLCTNCTAPLCADPVSVRKAGKLRPHLASLTTLKPNRPEAALLTGTAIEGMEGVPEAAEAFLRAGVKLAFVSLGSRGVYYSDGRQSGIQPICPADIINTTGCGDAFLAAVCVGIVKGYDIRRLALMGQAASAVCAEADAAVSPVMSMNRVQEKMDAFISQSN